MYSVPDATEEVVDAFSQSFSPFRLPQRLGDKKPSTDSDLGVLLPESTLSLSPVFSEAKERLETGGPLIGVLGDSI